jgi:hypothetical protein
MAAVTNNSLTGFLAVYAQESLRQFIAKMPPINLFTKNFDTSIANGGVSVTTRIVTTNWSTPNDLTQGWASSGASASAYTATLKVRDYDIAFNELDIATITPQMLTNLYLPRMVEQLANGIVVDAINNVTSSYFTNTVSPTSSSNFTVTGSTSLQQCATTLSNLEVPQDGRYAIVTPNVYQSLVSGILPTYLYGNPSAVQDNRVQKLINFDLYQYARLSGATKPNGGSSYGNSDKMVGFTGNQDGLVCAVRAPVDVNNGLVQSATAVDESSGLSLQTRWVYDVSKPMWRLAVVSVFGTTAGNANAIVPILTQSV